MITMRRLTIACFVVMGLCLVLAQVAHSDTLRVISPKRLETLHAFPVHVVVQFGEGTKPETFAASLNGVDITDLFAPAVDGVQGLIGLEQGLIVRVKDDPLRKPNTLQTKITSMKPLEDIEFETYFFCEVDQLMTTGSKGGTIQSVDQRLTIEIPSGALSSRVIMAVTKLPIVRGLGPTYLLSPKGAHFNKPIRVRFKYSSEELPPGVSEDDLFLVSGDGFQRKLDNIIVDKSSHSVSGMLTSFTGLRLSYYSRIGKKLSDIPLATDFRLPIGDPLDTRYTCGHEFDWDF